MSNHFCFTVFTLDTNYLDTIQKYVTQHKFGCPDSFITLVSQFHDGIFA